MLRNVALNLLLNTEFNLYLRFNCYIKPAHMHHLPFYLTAMLE